MTFASRLLAIAMSFAGLSPASAEPAFGPRAICRTAIALIAGREPKSLQATQNADGVVFITYVRPIDNFIWTYRCRIDGNRITWASEPGRWRDGPKDDTIIFEIVGAGSQLHLIESNVDGSIKNWLFDRDMIQ